MFSRFSVCDNENIEDECFCLFKSLKQTVEWLLAGFSPNVWNTYGSLSRFSAILDEIFIHGLICESPKKYWEFLNILFSSEEKQNFVSLLKRKHNVSVEHQLCHQWLEKCLLEHNLSNKLQMLIQSEHYISQFYKRTAFLRSKSCTNALLICLRSVERNQPALLTDLDPTLVVRTLSWREPIPIVSNDFMNTTADVCDNNKDIFETSSSLDYVTPPGSLNDFSLPSIYTDANGNCTDFTVVTSQTQNFNGQENHSEYNSQNFCGSSHVVSHLSATDLSTSTLSHSIQNSIHKENFIQNSFIPKSISNVTNASLNQSQNSSDLNYSSETISETNSSLKDGYPHMDWQIIADNLTVSDLPSPEISYSHNCLENSNEATGKESATVWKAQHSRSKSDGTASFHNISLEETETCTDGNFFLSLPSILSDMEKNKRKSIFEADQVVASTECFFPRPHPGQTLTSFLTSNDFNICAELDKENAHFFIAEALISAIEQIKCDQSMKQAMDEMESDEEIKTLTQRIRIRKTEKMREKAMRNFVLLSDGRTDTTSQSASPKSSSHSSEFDVESIGSEEDDIEDIEISEHNETNLNSVKESGLSLSMASLYSDADIKKSLQANTNIGIEEKKSPLENSAANLSAEAIALTLLKRFSEKQLPKASDLQWLISEEEVGQKLLPLPDSWPVSPDSVEEDYDLEKTRLRGNLEWAPPRLQIISTIHPYPRRSTIMQKQNFRCAGCGMKIEKRYMKKFRYCEYLGKYFCQCCHSNNTFYIPARILWKWDFKNYYVSRFAWKLLDQMFSDPLFNVLINYDLYKKVKQLNMCREYRLQLFYLKDFINTCRKATVIQKELESQPLYLLNNSHLYSISDFIQVKNGEFSRNLSILVSQCISHITQCILCKAKGFICEVCQKDKEIIFPFQLTKVVPCVVCGCCIHKKCYKGICPKCIRIKARKQKLLEEETTHHDSE